MAALKLVQERAGAAVAGRFTLHRRVGWLVILLALEQVSATLLIFIRRGTVLKRRNPLGTAVKVQSTSSTGLGTQP
jgi:hypothetical protein